MVVGSTQEGWHQEDLVPEGLQRGLLKLGRQAEPLEPVHQVVGQQEEMEVGLVGHEVASGDAAQGILSFELFDEQLHSGAVVVEAPEVQRVQRQIGDQDLVVISAKLEERELLAGRLGLGPSHDDEAVRMEPPRRLTPELGHLDPAAWAHIPQVRQPACDRSRQASDDHEAGSLLFEPLDQRMVVKPLVRADDHQYGPW